MSCLRLPASLPEQAPLVPAITCQVLGCALKTFHPLWDIYSTTSGLGNSGIGPGKPVTRGSDFGLCSLGPGHACHTDILRHGRLLPLTYLGGY